jgi:hypothetical protein
MDRLRPEAVRIEEIVSMCVSPVSVPIPSTESLHSAFLALLPRIQAHARFAFRRIRCEHERADCVAETLALAWKQHLALARRGKDAAAFPATLALRCSQAVKAGRRLHRMESGKDVLAPRAQSRRGFAVESLPQTSALSGNRWDEALHDNRVSPIPDQVAFRIDFPRWHGRRPGRDRAVLDDLMAGERTQEVADKHKLSSGRVAQLRREFHADWRRFHAEAPADGARVPADVA